jgi:ribosomal-protein-alanine N-acetyltransferase
MNARPVLRLRRMEESDVSSVMRLELASYEFPWTEGIFRDCLRVGYCCRVLEENGEVTGYGVMSIGAQEAHILTVCVTPMLRRLGLGERLLKYFMRYARRCGAEMIFLEVRMSNVAAQRLYEKLGFNELGLRKGYYPAKNGREDAIIFARHLG